ncbi:MAG: DUF547 domain-containing protein [Polyangiales bacterium]
MSDSWIRKLRDASDILRHARNPAELAKALVPNGWLSREILNDGVPAMERRSPSEVAEALRALRNALKREAIDQEGRVDYANLRTSPTFAEMEKASGLLRAIDPEEMHDDAVRIAFWINLYNVLSIHGVLALGIRRSVMEIPSFFGRVAYRVGDFVLTLDEIENGVLRRNAPHPATGACLFADDDPRLALCPSRVDARIHAALVCASTSCPAVAFYEASKLDEQLGLAALNYVASDVEIDDDSRVVRVPITFRYYQSDFGRLAGVRLFLTDHARGTQRAALEAAFQADYQLDYHRYDWSLNSMP